MGPAMMSYALSVPVLQHDDGSVGGMHDLDVTAPQAASSAASTPSIASSSGTRSG